MAANFFFPVMWQTLMMLAATACHTQWHHNATQRLWILEWEIAAELITDSLSPSTIVGPLIGAPRCRSARHKSTTCSVHVLTATCSNPNVVAVSTATCHGDTWTILPLIWLESPWQFTTFGHKLARQTVSVTGWNQSRAFLWSCVLGFAPHSVLLTSSGANVVLRRQSWWLWRKEAVIWIFWEGLLSVVLWMVVVNCQKGVVDFLDGLVNLIKMHLNLIYHEFFICDVHRQLVFWNIAVGKLCPKIK